MNMSINMNKKIIVSFVLVMMLVIGIFVPTTPVDAQGTLAVWAFGGNNYGQLGNGTTINRTTPVQVKDPGGVGFLTGVGAIAGGRYHSLALKDGTVWAWGFNDSGQLGDGTTINRTTPVQVSGLTGVAAIASGYGHSLALKTDGTAWAWGQNNGGQLGNGTSTIFGATTTPVQVCESGGCSNGYLTGVAAIAGGFFHSLALKTDGTVWAFGVNSTSQLGDGTTAILRNTPVQVCASGGCSNGYLTGVSAIAGGSSNSLALKTDGTVWAWGLNTGGQLGDGTTTNKNTPVQVLGLTGVSAIASGLFHFLVLKDGTAWAWGSNSRGQLGDGTTTFRATPVQVKGLVGVGFLTGVAAIAGGEYHSLALAPAAPPDIDPPDTTITDSPSNPSSSTSASFSFTGSDNIEVVGFDCSLDNSTFTSCSSPMTYSGLSEGSHTFQVRAKDDAGNVDPTPASFTWAVDTTSPVITNNVLSVDGVTIPIENCTPETFPPSLQQTLNYSLFTPDGFQINETVYGYFSGATGTVVFDDPDPSEPGDPSKRIMVVSITSTDYFFPGDFVVNDLFMPLVFGMISEAPSPTPGPSITLPTCNYGTVLNPVQSTNPIANLSGTVTDTAPGVVYSFKVNGVDVPFNLISGNFSTAVTLIEDLNTISEVAKDTAGNVALFNKKVVFHLITDNISPSVSITQIGSTATTPLDDSMVTSTSKTISGTAFDNIGVTGVTVSENNGTTYDPVDFLSIPTACIQGAVSGFCYTWTKDITATLPSSASTAALKIIAKATDGVTAPAITATVTLDNDGIDESIDTDDSIYSNIFTDGVTNGTITNRNGWTLHVSDITTSTPKLLGGTYSVFETGVQAQIIPGTTGTANATINTCHTFPAVSFPETVILKANNDTGNITCVDTITGDDQTTMLTTLKASLPSAGPYLRVQKSSLSGSNVTLNANLAPGTDCNPLISNVPASSTSCNTGSSGSPIMAALENPSNITWDVTNPITSYTYMTGILVPGDAKDIDFTGTEENPDSITITNLTTITNTFTSDGTTTVLPPGETFTDQCPGVSGNVGNTGCPFAIKPEIKVNLVDQRLTTNKASQIMPDGAEVRVVDFSPPIASDLYAQMVSLFDTGTIVGSCTTTNGTCLAGVPSQQQYSVIARFQLDGSNVYTAAPVAANNFGSDLIAKKVLAINVMIDKNGNIKSQAANQKIVTGSTLNIYEPAAIVVTDSTEIISFFYDTPDNYWDIVTNFVPPTGCTVDTTEQSVHVDQSMDAVIFTLTCDTSALAVAKANLSAQAARAIQVSNAAKAIHNLRDCTGPGHSCKPINVASEFAVTRGQGLKKGKPFTTGTSLWKLVETKVDNGITNREIANMVKDIAKKNDIAIPEWGISGQLDHRALSASVLNSLRW